MEPTDADRALFAQSLSSLAKFAAHTHAHVHVSTRQRHATQAGHKFTQLFFGPDCVVRPRYSSPLPSEYYRPDGLVWICDKCLKYFAQQTPFLRHLAKCRFVPGCEVYREVKDVGVQQQAGKGEPVSVFKLDGAEDKAVCQALCLLAKMFLDHKTLYYDTEAFLFYLLVEWVGRPHDRVLRRPRIVGYFSREKQSPSGYNLSCILVLPQHQRKGYGSLLIDLSYELSKREGNLGSTPEKPLSDLGLLSYVKYWTGCVLKHKHLLLQHPDSHGIQQVVHATGMTHNDVMATLEYLGAVQRSADRRIVCLRPDCIHAPEDRPMRTVDPQLYFDPSTAP